MFHRAFHSDHNFVEVFVNIFAGVDSDIRTSRLLGYLLDHTAASPDDLSDQVAWDHESQSMIFEGLLLAFVAIIKPFDEIFNCNCHILQRPSQFL